MNSAAFVSRVFAGLAAAALAGCTSGGGPAGEPADTSVKDAPSESADATVTHAPTDANVTDALAEAYSGPCTFSADAFDLSCATDTDCVGVPAGYYCSPAQCGCTLIGISRSALGTFNAAEAKTPLGSGAVVGVDCGCPAEGPICCRSGECQTCSRTP